MKINMDCWCNGSDSGQPVPGPFCQPQSSYGFSDTKINLNYKKSFNSYFAVNTLRSKYAPSPGDQNKPTYDITEL